MGFDDDPKKISGYILSGLSMMLNIRLSYSSAPYALIRFRLPENLFSVFVRRMASALELWCLPSMVLGNIMEQVYKRADLGVDKQSLLTYPSIFWSWCNFLTFVILLFVYRAGGDQGHLTTFYWVIAASGFVFGINMVLLYAQEGQYLTWYMIGENSFPAVTSLMHYITTLIFGNRRKWNSDYLIVNIDIWVAIMISLVAAAVWTAAYYDYKDSGAGSGGYKKLNLNADQSRKVLSYSSEDAGSTDGHQHKGGYPTHTHIAAATCNYNTTRWHNFSPVSMVIVGMGLVYMIYPAIAPGMIVPFYLVDRIDMILLIATAVPPVIVALLKKYEFGPFVFLGNWGGNHNAFAINTTITQATLDLSQLTDTHILTLKNTSDVLEVKYTVPEEQKGKITRIKGQTGTATINLTLTLTEVTLTLNGNTLKATGSITVTRNVTPSGGQKLETALAGSHTLEFTTTSTLTQGNLDSGGSNSVTIGPGSGATNSLNLTAGANGGPTKLNLTLKAGTKSGGGENTSLTLDSGNNTLQLSGGIEGSLEYTSASSGTLTANIINISFDPNDFHYTSETPHPKYCCIGGALTTWETGESGMPAWHLCDVFVILMIILAIIFVYSLHYRDSAISRAIINQPKMSTALSIVFYMCHEISLAVGFPGIASDDDVILPVQLVGAFLMVLLAPYSEGYLIEYKRHDPAHWPTEGMTKWNAFCYWCKRASKITNHNLRSLFTTDLRRDLLLCIQKNELI